MRFRFIFGAAVVFVAFLLWVLATGVMAQGEPPPPYAGLKNPFQWSDSSAQEAGKGVYLSSCQGCHGATGSNIAGADFSASDFPHDLENRPDFYFWIVSEGTDYGMPSFKSALAEEQRWQVLTYLWSLGATSPAEAPPSTTPPAEAKSSTLSLSTPAQGQPGQPMSLTAVLKDMEGKPITGAPVKFYISADFFASGLMEVGEAVTNDRGVAVLNYTPKLSGDVQVEARYDDIEATTALILIETDKTFYQAEAGIRLPAPGKEVVIGPESAVNPTSGSPVSALRLPGGILSWLLLFAVTLIVLWFTYFRAVYQVFRIPIRGEIKDTDTRLVPSIGLAIIVALGILLVLILVTGPYSNPHLLR